MGKLLVPFLAVLVTGGLTALEGATNGWMTKSSGSLWFALAVAFALSGVLMLAAAPFLHVRPQWGELRGLPAYAWLGGVYLLITVALAAWATPKLGAGPAMIAALLAQTTVGLALDNFGVLGLEKSPVSWLKIVGVAVMLGGALLVALGERK